ncbi:folylpolyglutamate synthase, mitochondrial-like [Anoplophora glabripennis]|uniref:folylpolyglutamate synthase, mitochondrial-like n=1 Tax=Anoplophora glabripennis TaxID=217634 RepID=UPI000874D533|nr:folylpolyglutamate synthase, mitochondrial-like [Anoplophora glabripennis]
MIVFSSLLIKSNLLRTFTILKRKMLPKQGKTYQDAIATLNSLQTNSQYLKNAVVKPKAETNLAEVEKFLNRTSLPLDDLNKLSVIHIAGTNGKGTTCAYSENILRNHGFKTGFYSSPHLLDVRERIRINGKPISKKTFALHFWKIYDLLDKQKTDPGDMPLYFRYLTILAFHIFLEHKVDVAIVEVGIGGEYDCTNVLRKSQVVGITPLDFDHTSLLGHSMESIAWNKSGIMKEGSIAFTTEQPESALKVLRERSLEKKCDLKVVENNYYNYENKSNFPSHIQRTNASLALAICEAYIKRGNKPQKMFSMEIAKNAIEDTYWPGRYEIKDLNKIRFFLDGAHTIDSMRICTNWFREKTLNSCRKRALIFNLTGDRLSDTFFKELCKLTFNIVIFSPNVSSEKDVPDNTDLISTPDKQLQRCNQFKEKWLKMEESVENKADSILVFPCFSEAIKCLDKGIEYDVLVTGSIHLIGAAMAVIDPTLNGTLVD